MRRLALKPELAYNLYYLGLIIVMTTKNAAPEVVIELTKTYLHKLSDRELQDHFINFSDRFADSLKTGAEDELEMLQAYLRLITTEMSARLKGTTNA